MPITPNYLDVAAHLNEYPPGPVHISPSRSVWWTGRVAIGLRYAEPARDMGAHAEVVQALMCRSLRTSLVPWRRPVLSRGRS